MYDLCFPLAKGEGTECQGGCSIGCAIQERDVFHVLRNIPLPPSQGGGVRLN